MLYYQAKQDNKKLNAGLYSIKGELFTQREISKNNINTTSLVVVSIPKSQTYFSFGARLPCHDYF